MHALSSLSLPTTATFYHWDLDDFFMFGSTKHHTTHAPQILYQSHRQLVKQIVEFLLSHQFFYLINMWSVRVNQMSPTNPSQALEWDWRTAVALQRRLFYTAASSM
eukprot:5995881-Karenia_brevis.AAC.1